IAALLTVLAVSGALPLHAAGDAELPPAEAPAAPVRVYPLGDTGYLDPAEPVTPFRDAEARIEITPPRARLLAPVTALARASDEDTYEVTRYQIALRDATLYTQPVPVTSGLLADAGAVLSLSLTREGGVLVGADLALLDQGLVQHSGGA